MKALRVFIFGMLYGWLLKFAIDRIYQRNEVEEVRSENAALREYIRSLETKLQSRPPEVRSIPPATAQSKPIQTGTDKDDLKLIKGIGPAIERKLNDAGIYTFEALGQLTVEQLENILGSTKRLVQDKGNLIAQAERFAQQKDQQQ